MSTVDTATTTLLSIENASVAFGSFWAVRNVSLELKGGTLLGLIGPNGAGKTTLMRAAVGLQALRRGVVRVMDFQIGKSRDALRHIGFTSDTPPMYDGLSVRDFLRFIGKGYQLSTAETEERIDFWLEKVWLKEKANQKIKQLSRGMRQRVGIARTLLPNPAVILLAAGLDPAGRAQFRQLLLSLRDQGKALIVSSHILSDMDEYCSHIGIMSAGRMIRIGTVAEIAGATHPARCRYTIVLARASPQMKPFVESIPGAGDVTLEGECLKLEYDSGRDAAAHLLAQLVAAGIPVAEFSANTASLEETYLREQIRQVD
jgi:ABC-2 type transport system ATP-binding protein